MEPAIKLAGELRRGSARRDESALEGLYDRRQRRLDSTKTAVRAKPCCSIAESRPSCPADFTDSSQAQEADAGPARRGQIRQGNRLGLRRNAGAGKPAAGRNARPLHRPGRAARNLQPSPCRPARLQQRRTYTPLSNLAPGQAKFTIINTMLSELAVLGFEYGFSSGRPAQSGDLGSAVRRLRQRRPADHRSDDRRAESKWRLSNGLVMLLPHGFEGAGPRAFQRLSDRFLGLCAEDNMQVCVPSTPGQYFHLLRRQIHRKFRKPLILMMPKFLLRYEPSSSAIEDFADGSAFQPVIDDPTAPERDSVRRVLFCCGKVLLRPACPPRKGEAQRDCHRARRAALSVPQEGDSGNPLSRYRQARDICWVQDEPRNRGAWSFMQELLAELLPDPAVLNYVGRDAAASGGERGN
jgi:hypothetical protein